MQLGRVSNNRRYIVISVSPVKDMLAVMKHWISLAFSIQVQVLVDSVDAYPTRVSSISCFQSRVSQLVCEEGLANIVMASQRYGQELLVIVLLESLYVFVVKLIVIEVPPIFQDLLHTVDVDDGRIARLLWARLKDLVIEGLPADLHASWQFINVVNVAVLDDLIKEGHSCNL